MSSFENLRVVDNFYQTSLFFPMPTVVISTLCEDGSTTLGPYSLVQPYYVAGKDYYAMLLSCRNSSNTAQNILRSGKCAINFVDDKSKTFKECGVGVGTVYNYFPSKDALLATYMLEDWNKCVATINAVSTYSDQPAPLVRCICDQIRSFADLHTAVFQDEAAAAGFAGSHSKYHALLRSQLAQPLRKFCQSDFSAEFIAEALLTWTVAGKTFDEIYSMIEKLM